MGKIIIEFKPLTPACSNSSAASKKSFSDSGFDTLDLVLDLGLKSLIFGGILNKQAEEDL